MSATSTSLLLRLREGQREEDWAHFVKLYTPLLYFWANRLGLQQEDAADLLQEVFTILVAKLPEFNYKADGSFRGWLRTILTNCWRNWKRKRTPQQLNEAIDNAAVPDHADALAESEYRDQLVKRALELLRGDFEERTWRAFWETETQSRPVAEVAAELDMNIGAVYAAKSRVLNRLREELAGLLE